MPNDSKRTWTPSFTLLSKYDLYSMVFKTWQSARVSYKLGEISLHGLIWYLEVFQSFVLPGGRSIFMIGHHMGGVGPPLLCCSVCVCICAHTQSLSFLSWMCIHKHTHGSGGGGFVRACTEFPVSTGLKAPLIYWK